MIAQLAVALFQVTLPPTSCPPTSDAAAMSSALVCMPLVATPDLPAASGLIQLLPVHTPFGVAVTVDGRPRQRLVADIAGLPAPQSLGPYTTYVAWAYTLSIDSASKLGPVRNGRVDLGILERVQFRILISAERSSAVRQRAGRLVLRGTSPSARLLAHRDLLQPSAVGVPGTPPGAAATDSTRRAMAAMTAMHGASAGAAIAGAGSWTMPPMQTVQRRTPMMPGMAGLVPSTPPFLPATIGDAVPPRVRPRSVVQLRTGDTLALEAGLVTRSVAGRSFTSYAFNGQLPGPLIEVEQGATIVVKYHNAIGQPSSVHWHGVRLDNASDGAAGLTQEAVPPGGAYSYTVHFPDAGVYWYHPHVREDIQQSLGLYGNLLVKSPAPDFYGPADREEILTLDDALLGDNGPAAYGEGAPTHALMGRWGNVLLVNGEPHYALSVRRGEVVRFFFTNVSSARVWNLSFAGARMKIVASDVGKFEHEEWAQSVVMAPAERYVVEVRFDRSGTVALLNRVQALDHMIGSYVAEVDTLGGILVSSGPASRNDAAAFATLRQNADVAASILPYRKYFDNSPDRQLVLTLRTRALPAPISNMLLGINAPVEWNDGMPMANWLTTGNEITWILRDPATGKENMDIDWRFRAGDVVKVRLFNDPASSHAMDHPVHLHGQRFLVLARDGVRNSNLVWKDTAIIAAGETVDLLVDMSNPGRWMLHCHITEHLSAGMMSVFTVEPR
jgi:suppressor of ftsI